MTGPNTNGKKLYIQEVAPRDGFQNEKQFIETQDKIAFINQLSLPRFQPRSRRPRSPRRRRFPRCATPRS